MSTSQETPTFTHCHNSLSDISYLKIQILFCFIAILTTNSLLRAPDSPTIPIGSDAYTMYDRWPQQRIGVRAYMRSTYDRTGGNETADAGHFLYQEGDDCNVTLDIEGRGILYFVRYNHWHGSPWHYVVDGADHVVTETSTADPNHPVDGAKLEPAAAMPQPMTTTWSTTKGADLSGIPVAFDKSFKMAYERTHYGTGYYIFHQFAAGIKLSREITPWDATTPPDNAALDILRNAGNDLSPASAEKHEGVASLPKDSSVTFAELTGAQTIRAIELSLPKSQAEAFSAARLRITWDAREHPSIEAPAGLFFGAGVFYNRDAKEYLVKSLPVVVQYTPDRVRLACYFPMPFFKSAKLELVGTQSAIDDIRWTIKTVPNTDAPETVAYLHATYVNHGEGVHGKDLEFLDTRNIEGSPDWSGNFVGTSFIFSRAANLRTLEGDPRFFFDDSQSPQAQGTGTEEWGGGGDYWGGENMTLPLVGHPLGVRLPKDAKDERDKIESAYRFLLADLFPLGKYARICLEHGGRNETREHYESVTYWYGYPAATLIQTDTLQIGDESSEASHVYSSPDATKPYELSSRYEWGVDHLDKEEIFPETIDHGRITAGTSEFTLKIDPNNLGLLLRRKLDYQCANQRAEVSIADIGKENWQPAGVWYTAGSNTCVYSNPKQELSPTLHKIQTANRRFRDDEFLIGRELTQGKSAIRVRIKFTPVHRVLFPTGPDMPTAWSEIRYDCYCYVMPHYQTQVKQ